MTTVFYFEFANLVLRVIFVKPPMPWVLAHRPLNVELLGVCLHWIFQSRGVYANKNNIGVFQQLQ